MRTSRRTALRRADEVSLKDAAEACQSAEWITAAARALRDAARGPEACTAATLPMMGDASSWRIPEERGPPGL
jgi:hypothetical protein